MAGLVAALLAFLALAAALVVRRRRYARDIRRRMAEMTAEAPKVIAFGGEASGRGGERGAERMPARKAAAA